MLHPNTQVNMIRVVAALIPDRPWTGFPVDPDMRFLVGERQGGKFDGAWEFPGGKVEPGESDAQAVVRELREELGVAARVLGDAIVASRHHLPNFPPFEVWLYPAYVGDAPRAIVHRRLAYATLAEIARLPASPSTPVFLFTLRGEAPTHTRVVA